MFLNCCSGLGLLWDGGSSLVEWRLAALVCWLEFDCITGLIKAEQKNPLKAAQEVNEEKVVFSVHLIIWIFPRVRLRQSWLINIDWMVT